MSSSVKIDVHKSFEVDLLDRPFSSTKDLFIKNCLVGHRTLETVTDRRVHGQR